MAVSNIRDLRGPGAGNGGGRSPAGFRERPHSVEIEQRVLGILVLNNHALARVSDRLRPEHFYVPRHAILYEQARQRIINGRLADIDALSEGMADDERRAMWDIATLSSAALPEDIDQCADELISLWQRRRQIEVGETLVNASYDLTVPLDEWRQKAIEELASVEKNGPVRRTKPCDLPCLDWMRVANEEPPADRWLIERWLPVGTCGILAGPGAAGKSFLALILLICLASGRLFLKRYPLERVPCIGYFSEDSQEVLWRRARRICTSYGIDPRELTDTLEIVSTVGSVRHLLNAESNASSVSADDWLHQVHDRARARKMRFVSFDHVGRYWAVNRNDPNQVFASFGYLDELATSIDGCACMLAHPSKTDIRAKTATGKQANPSVFIGGSAAMYDAPRWIHLLTTIKENDHEARILTYDKPNYGKRFSAKLDEDDHRVSYFLTEVDPDDPCGEGSISSRNSSRGVKSKADRTFLAFEELFLTHHRAIHVDEVIPLCITRGIVGEAVIGSAPWRDRRRTVREHLSRFPKHVELRDNDTFAMLPGA